MKRIITAHIYNTTLMLFFLGVLGVLSLVAMVTSFFAALGQSVLGWGHW